MESFGPELKETPYPLIATLGSRALQAQLVPHILAVNEECTLKLHVASLSREHCFPVKKELREKHGTFQTQRDFEGYLTRGILKVQWLKKQQELLPAVVLLVDEFDPQWEPHEWQRKETALRDDVETLRRVLSGACCLCVSA